MAKRERLVKVRSESELRVGMIVVVKKCRSCAAPGGAHRVMLLRRHAQPGWAVAADGSRRQFGTWWETAPDMHPPGGPFDHAIATGRLYRVVDGLEKETAKSKDRELERAR